jgi:type IV pilus assembly protein PilO
MESGSFYERIAKIKLPFRIIILVGTVVLLSALFFWLIYMPKAEAIEKGQQENARLQQRLNQAKIRAKGREKFKRELAQVEQQFREALKLLPNEKEIPELLRKVTQLGTDSRLEFRLFKPEKEKAQDFYMEIPVSIEVSGTYHDVALFFDRVGRMERIVNILNVSMKPDQARSTNLTTSCDAVTFRFKGTTDATPPK